MNEPEEVQRALGRIEGTLNEVQKQVTGLHIRMDRFDTRFASKESMEVFATKEAVQANSRRIASLERTRWWLATSVIGAIFLVAANYLSEMLTEARRHVGL